MHVIQWGEGIAPVQDLIRSGVQVDHHRLGNPAVPLADTAERPHMPLTARECQGVYCAGAA